MHIREPRFKIQYKKLLMKIKKKPNSKYPDKKPAKSLTKRRTTISSQSQGPQTCTHMIAQTSTKLKLFI